MCVYVCIYTLLNGFIIKISMQPVVSKSYKNSSSYTNKNIHNESFFEFQFVFVFGLE